jgi:multicomponent Na+:H+ antiporter subunit D
MLTALGLSSGPALSGAMLYLIGHGLVKGSLFMGAGILLARCSGIDEIGLRGRGRDIWPAGLAFALGGVLLAGLPIGLLDQGSEAINQAAERAGQYWVGWLTIFAGGLTGGAVLRSAGRIYLGWGELPGEEAASPSEPEEETSARPLWLMLLPAAVLVLADLPAGAWTRHFAEAAGAAFACREAATGLITPACANAAIPTAGGLAIQPWLPLLLALCIASYDLGRKHIPSFVRFVPKVAGRGVLLVLDRLHSGVIGDYVTWLSLGMGALTLAVLWL